MFRLFDTRRGKKRPFRPLKGNLVRIYSCGPSVYAYSHIGNFRTYLFEDVLVRYLRYKGYSIKRVMNITDVEDKAVEAARREGMTLERLQKDKIRRFFSDFKALRMVRPDVVARASRHVPAMLRLISRICAKGYCISEPDGIYFDVRKFRRYGSLDHKGRLPYMGTARKDDYAKVGAWDFRLWKRWTRGDGDVFWDGQFGKGRPGWHIECSAMSMEYLGERFDIHCGGVDNIFPHHENEIAQSESATGKPPANFWLHARHLTINKRKMSKRTGNVLYVGQLRKMGVPSGCLRFYLISECYRRPLDFTLRRFRATVCRCHEAARIVARLRRARSSGNGKLGKIIAERLLSGFESAMDDDLDTGLAFRRVFRIFDEVGALLKDKGLSRADAIEICRAVDRIDSVLWVF
jgi:cysteinyl-tRNA synthetase